MNIFALDPSPNKAAMYAMDKHVVKMILETAQILSTNMRLVGCTEFEGQYKSTHTNHPSTIWARSSRQNFLWLVEYLSSLGDEYTFRYEKKHTTIEKMAYVLDNRLRISIQFENLGLTPVTPAMPDDAKVFPMPLTSTWLRGLGVSLQTGSYVRCLAKI